MQRTVFHFVVAYRWTQTIYSTSERRRTTLFNNKCCDTELQIVVPFVGHNAFLQGSCDQTHKNIVGRPFFYNNIRRTDIFYSAIKDIEDVLGPSGIANPYNVPAAAEILGTYSLLFDSPNEELHELANIMREAQSP